MDIPLHAIRYFCVLADELHFARAAQKLTISAPTLSQQVHRLEATLGLRLFERSSRRVQLTTAGLDLLPLARRVRDDHDQVLVWARANHARGPGDVLRIGLVAAGGGPLTTTILSSVVQQMPSLRIEMRREGFFDATRDLVEGRVDVVFAPAPIEFDARVASTPLWTEPRVLVVPSDHALAMRESIGIMETSGETFVGASGGVAEVLDWWLVDPRPDGSHPRRGPVADDFEGLLELVAAGVGVNIASLGASRQYRRDGLAFVRIHDIEPATILLCSLVHPSNAGVEPFLAHAVGLACRAAIETAGEFTTISI